jgi:soluble lytic murein transglycosylase
VLKFCVRFSFAFATALAALTTAPLTGIPAHAATPAPQAAQATHSTHTKKKSHASAGSAPSPSPTKPGSQLELLSRQLKDKSASAAYTKLSAIANAKGTGVTAQRAALALGFYDLDKKHYSQAQQWLQRAMPDPLLHEYALFYNAQANLEQSHNAEALAQLKLYRKENPDGIFTEQAVQGAATAALAVSQPAEALGALDGYAETKDRPALLLLRGDAHAAQQQPLQAAVDYQSIYLKFPTSDVAGKAAERLEALRGPLGGKFPEISLQHQIEHAATIYGQRQWSNARNEYSHLITQATGADKERAEMRVLACGVALGASPVSLVAMSISEPDVDAERYYFLANHYRTKDKESDMLAAIESAASRAPKSGSTEQALFLGGNYFWVQLDRDRAAGYYKRLADNFPSSADANNADWRVTWAAIIKRHKDASDQIARHLTKFPGSPYTSDALYWLGRLAEESDNRDAARAYYSKLQVRFPQNYFTQLATARFRVIGHGPGDPSTAALIATIPALPASKPLGATIPAAAATRQARADALRTIAFDASAELELRAAYAATGEPRLLLEAAQEAVNAGHVGAAIVTIRQMYPQLESRPLAEVPREVWFASYALPYLQTIRTHAAQAGVDPMLAAGLIRQESAFTPDAHSGANAWGLMQLEPKTARQLAARNRVRYSSALLIDPDFNIRIGTILYAGLRKSYGTDESALAAYNAGETRVSQWNAGQSYREPAEFVDSIPFTETREYVEIVSRNAEIYRKLYGEQNESSGKASASRSGN